MNTEPEGVAARVRGLAEFLVENDLQCVRIERDDDVLEVRRAGSDRAAAHALPLDAAHVPSRIEQIAADRVGIFHFARAVPFVGEVLDGDRELGYVEQLGIRNPVRSRGPGRVVAVLQRDGDLVDYGRPLFELERA